jgi:uncharacterized protein (TIGR02246 family)
MAMNARKRIIAGAFATSAAVWTVACQSPALPDIRPRDEALLREADLAWGKTIVDKDTDGFLSFYADDAVLLAPNAPRAEGKEQIRAWIQPIFDMQGVSATSGPVKVEVARSGDLGYVWGTYKQTIDKGKGKTIEETGKYLEVWRKQSDGTWKCIVDTINSDSPAGAK